ncbi:hypothetical protein RQP46_009014 [Phenoliferia psychrophenolica]
MSKRRVHFSDSDSDVVVSSKLGPEVDEEDEGGTSTELTDGELVADSEAESRNLPKKWTKTEDLALIAAVHTHGEKWALVWNDVGNGNNRTQSACRERWTRMKGNPKNRSRIERVFKRLGGEQNGEEQEEDDEEQQAEKEIIMEAPDDEEEEEIIVKGKQVAPNVKAGAQKPALKSALKKQKQNKRARYVASSVYRTKLGVPKFQARQQFEYLLGQCGDALRALGAETDTDDDSDDEGLGSEFNKNRALKALRELETLIETC